MADAESSAEALITEFGARPDGATINTKAIQTAIDHLALRHGGTVVIPQGTFVSGALFFKPQVNLHLRAGASAAVLDGYVQLPRPAHPD